jgi:hypothetical protein
MSHPKSSVTLRGSHASPNSKAVRQVAPGEVEKAALSAAVTR